MRPGRWDMAQVEQAEEEEEVGAMDLAVRSELSEAGVGREVAISHGEVRLAAGGRRMQAHVAVMTDPGDMLGVIEALQKQPAWADVSGWPCALRVSIAAAARPTDASVGPEASVDGLLDGPGPGPEPPNHEAQAALGTEVEEDANDGNCLGVGDKLLHLLQRWSVRNVGIVVTIWEDGCSKATRGPAGALYKAVVDCAKEALESCFLGLLEEQMQHASKGSVLRLLEENSTAVGVAPEELAALPALGSLLSERRTSHSVDTPHDMLASSSSFVQMYVPEDAAKRPGRAALAAGKAANSRRKPLPIGSAVLAPDVDTAPQGQGSRSGGPQPPLSMKPVPRGHFMFGRDTRPLRPGQRQEQQEHRQARRLAAGQAARRRGEPSLRVVTRPPVFSSEEVHELRVINKPHALVAGTFAQVGMLLGVQDTSWWNLRPLFRAAELKARMTQVVITRPAAQALDSWMRFHAPNAQARARVLKVSPAAGKAVSWLQAVSAAANEEFGLSDSAREREEAMPAAGAGSIIKLGLSA